MPTQHGRARGVAKLVNKQNCGGNKKAGSARGIVAPQNMRCSVVTRLPNPKQNIARAADGTCSGMAECSCSAKCNMHFST